MDCVTRSGGYAEEIRKFVTLGEYSTAAQHVPLPCRMVLTFRLYIAFLPSSACNAEVCLLGFTTLTVTALRLQRRPFMCHRALSYSWGTHTVTPSAGILCAPLWPILQRRLSLTSLRVLIILIIATSVMLHGVIRLFA
jgi:hypothetical protein